jgi:flavin reductase (DIM6/NTAB) family NADH-FMN oxidoreductase RutF
MLSSESYELIRQFVSPVVAVTSAWRGRTNGMISDSVIRASLSPKVPRLAVLIHKWHFSHELIWASGRLAVHLLHRGQLDLVYQLGFTSGRDRDKLGEVAHRASETGVPILEDCHAAFELQVINSMDVGYATQFLGDVVAFHRGAGVDILTAEYLRTHLPPSWQEAWLRNYRIAQEQIDAHFAIQDRRWMAPAPD